MIVVVVITAMRLYVGHFVTGDLKIAKLRSLVEKGPS